MAIILDTGTEWFSNSESPFHPDASHQVSAQPDVWRISRWQPGPSWISKWNDFSNFEFLCHCDASHQVSALSDLGFRRRCRLKNFKIAALAAILDIRTERFQQFSISVPLWYLPSSFNSDVVWRISRWPPCSHLRYRNGTTLAISNLCVTVMPPIKFQLNGT